MVQVDNLQMYFLFNFDWLGCLWLILKVVDDVSFVICKGEIFGLVGESGLGKFIVVWVVLWVYDFIGGSVWFCKFDGIIEQMVGMDIQLFRQMCCYMQMVFQDLYLLLNLWMIVEQIIGELMVNQGEINCFVIQDCVVELLI